MEATRKAHSIIIGKPEEKMSEGCMSRWEDNIKMVPNEARYKDVDWIHLAQDGCHHRALEITAVNLWVL
jgi:hypothetical protein